MHVSARLVGPAIPVLRLAALLGCLGSACGGPLPIGETFDGGDGVSPETDVTPRDDGAEEARTDTPVVPCSGDCTARRRTLCSCAASDPCGWAGDGTCDNACDTVLPTGHFDDSVDCPPPPVCSGDCTAHRYSICSCGAGDPCAWAGNGTCDRDSCTPLSGSHFDDGADCPPAGLTYIVTAVDTDGLDPTDMDLAASALAGLGYSEITRDTSVTSAELASYLGQDVTTLYHTGHGNDGMVMTADGFFTMDMVSGGRIHAVNTIWATCLTLVPSWAGTMGASAQSVLGYTEESFDMIDNDVVNAMVSPLRSGRSYIFAWYQANAGVDMLYDRWAGYVREGTIVEYSARSGRTPTAEPLHAAWVTLADAGNVWATEDVLADTRTFDGRFADVRVVAPGALMTDPDGGGFERLGPSAMSAAEAEDLAWSWLDAHGGIPIDAVPGAIVDIVRRLDETDAGVVVGRLVRFVREAAGLPVRGNLVEHHIAVLVGPDGVVSVSRFWPELSVGASSAASLLDVPAAVRAAAGPLSRAVKGGEVRIVGVVPVYGTRGLRDAAGPLVPAYALRTTRGFSLVIDAATGEPLL
jgi:hypothetical protein